MKRWSFDVRSWEIIQATPLGRKRASLEEGRDSWHGLCARRAPTVKRWSLDARNGDHTSHLAECRGRVELSLISTRAVEGNPLAPPFENGKEVRVEKLMLAFHEEIWRESYY